MGQPLKVQDLGLQGVTCRTKRRDATLQLFIQRGPSALCTARRVRGVQEGAGLLRSHSLLRRRVAVIYISLLGGTVILAREPACRSAKTMKRE